MNLTYNVEQTSSVNAPLMSNMEPTYNAPTAVPMAVPASMPAPVPIQPVAPVPLQPVAPIPAQPAVTSPLDYLMQCKIVTVRLIPSPCGTCD